METLEHRIRYRSRKDEWRLYPIGDIHAGVKQCQEKMLKAQVDIIKNDERALWIGMGDYADCIVPSDSRWDVEVVADWVERSNIVESQRKWLVKLFSPIADKCVGLLSGNHEELVRLRNYQDIYLDICRDLEVPVLGYSCFVRFVFSRSRTGKHGSCIFIGAFEHGSGGAQTEGGKVMRLKRLMDKFDADIYAMGHLHDIKVNQVAQLWLNKELKVRDKVRVGAITGSWMETYTQGVRAGYAERAGYNPTVLGCPHFIIIPDKNIVRVVGR